MKTQFLISFLLFSLFFSCLTLDFTCVACTIGVNGLIQGVGREREALKRALSQLCTFFPRDFNGTCVTTLRIVGDILIELILQGDSPSKICNTFPIFKCNGCTLTGSPASTVSGNVSSLVERFSTALELLESLHLPPLTPENLSKLSFLNNPRVLPTFDSDRDFFSPSDFMLRGAHWRGRDCADSDASRKPGIKPKDSDQYLDSDCNGIFGKNSHGIPYEELFCRGDNSGRQIIIFGDSASSGFTIPLEWLFFQKLDNIVTVLQNEFDHPQSSFATGQIDSSINSIYLQMSKRNRCNHRQYQNVGYNGGEMNDLSMQIQGLSMTPDSKPFIGFLNYIGNDVCRRSPDLITTDANFEIRLKKGLDELEAVSPPGSKLLLFGLVDGRILWKEMAQRKHPGFPQVGITYKQLYSFLDCVDANACRTWLSVNDTLREYASKRADELSIIAEKFVKENHRNYKNIELAYMNFPLDLSVEEVRRRGRSPHELINDVDGFHPSLFGHTIFADMIWRHLEINLPHWIGVPNPNNHEISKIFGSQGGH